MKAGITTFLFTLIFGAATAQNIAFKDITSANVQEYLQQDAKVLQMQEGSLEITVQMGNGNVIETFDKSPEFLNIQQYGNNNTTYFINPNNYPTNAELKINGSGNYIDITGSNSISSGMKMNINANDMTIFMRNY